MILIYPVRGHSFLGSDRFFGRIQQDVNALETVLLPKQYHAIFKEHMQSVFVYDSIWSVYNWKTTYNQNDKLLETFQKVKRIKFVIN